MPKTLNIAVIGAGTMAQAVHLPVLRRRWDRFAVTALVDHSERRRRESAEVWGIAEEKRYATVGDLVEAIRSRAITVDAALLSTDGLHVDDLLQLLRRGVPVLVEPPLGYSAAEIAKIADFERMTGRNLVMMAYPQQYDDSVGRIAEQIAVKDVRMIEHRVLMPASQPLFGGAHVTTSAYDLPAEQRSERRNALQEAVVAGSGESATQRDRDLYVKGLLTGVAHQLSVIESVYGPLTELTAVRHWPKGVIPGSIELLGELEGGAHVHLVWHYLPFAPEYSETLQILSARKRLDLELFAPSHGDRRSTLHLREKKSGVVTEVATVAGLGSAESMWEAFHAFVEKGEVPISGPASAQQQVTLLRKVLAAIVEADGRDIDAVVEKEESEADAPVPAEEGTGIEVVAPAAPVAAVADPVEPVEPAAPAETVVLPSESAPPAGEPTEVLPDLSGEAEPSTRTDGIVDAWSVEGVPSEGEPVEGDVPDPSPSDDPAHPHESTGPIRSSWPPAAAGSAEDAAADAAEPSTGEGSAPDPGR